MYNMQIVFDCFCPSNTHFENFQILPTTSVKKIQMKMCRTSYLKEMIPGVCNIQFSFTSIGG